MPVVEIPQALGSWSVTLANDTPRAIIDALQYFGHIAISTSWNDPRVAGDSLLSSARYVGPLTGINPSDTNFAQDSVNSTSIIEATAPTTGYVLSGVGMWTWLGDSSQRGQVYQTPVVLTAATFATGLRDLLPVALQAGNITNPASGGTQTQTFQFVDPGTAVTTWCGLFNTVARVNGNGTVDAGPVADIFVTNPVAAIVKSDYGRDMTISGIAANNSLNEDVNDFTTQVLLLGTNNNGTQIVTGSANLASIGAANPYLDLFGNPVVRDLVTSDSTSSATSAPIQAQQLLAQYSTPRDQVLLTSAEYDIKGLISAGDYIWVYDPAADLLDLTHEITYRGQKINPALLQVIELDWPIMTNMGVAFRDGSGNWTDLTQYVVWDTGTTNVVVGGYNRSLLDSGESVSLRLTTGTPTPETPGVPVFGAFSSASYQSGAVGDTRSAIQAVWSTPLNTDGSTIDNGDHYEIQYQPDIALNNQNPSYTALNTAGYTYTDLNQLGGAYDQLIPVAAQQWKVTYVAWGVNTLLIQELTPGVYYNFQIRAVNADTPPTQGAWSATTVVQAASNTVAPPTPDAPTVASDMASVQITWDCGQASGGAYNQAVDLNHIEVHGSYDPLFTPVTATHLGNLSANIGNIVGQIPVIGSFTIPPNLPPAQSMFVKIIAVDNLGNKSNPSASAGSTATLWSDAYITTLNVSKLVSGTVTASVVVAGTIATSLTGNRAGIDSTGLWCYDANGDQTLFADAATGQVTLSSSGSGQRVALNTLFNLTPYGVPETVDALVFYTDAVSAPAILAGYTLASGVGGTLVLAAAPAALASAQGAWGVASSYTPVVSLESDGPGTLAYVDATSTNFSGGAFQVTPTLAFAGMANESSLAGGILITDNASSNTEPMLEFLGYTRNAGTVAPNPVDTMFTGQINGLTSGTNSILWSYGATMDSTPTPIAVGSCGTTSTVPAGVISGLTVTGFTWTASANYPASWSVFFHALRVR